MLLFMAAGRLPSFRLSIWTVSGVATTTMRWFMVLFILRMSDSWVWFEFVSVGFLSKLRSRFAFFFRAGWGDVVRIFVEWSLENRLVIPKETLKAILLGIPTETTSIYSLRIRSKISWFSSCGNFYGNFFGCSFGVYFSNLF